MTAARWDIAIEQGAAFDQSYLVLGGDGNPLDLTDCTAAMQVRVSLGDPTALLTLTTGNGGLILDPAAGTITPVIDTEALSPGRYVYDLKLTDSGGEVFYLLQGAFSFIGVSTTI